MPADSCRTGSAAPTLLASQSPSVPTHDLVEHRRQRVVVLAAQVDLDLGDLAARRERQRQA